MLEPTQGSSQVLNITQKAEDLVYNWVFRHAFFAKQCDHSVKQYVSLLTNKFIWDVAGDEDSEVHNANTDNLIYSFMWQLVLDKVDVLQRAHLAVHGEIPEVSPNATPGYSVTDCVQVVGEPGDRLLIKIDLCVGMIVLIEVDSTKLEAWRQGA